MEQVKVLVVDDSSFMRLVIRDMISQSPALKVIDVATDGKEAVEKTVKLKPDVVVLDLMMDKYDGFYAIDHIMQEQPTPIVVLSSLGSEDRKVVFDALDRGAVDFLNKPEKGRSGKIRGVGDELIYKLKHIKSLSTQNLTKEKDQKQVNAAHTFTADLPYDLIVVGASTGGPGIVEGVLKKLPSNLPLPVVVVQHMPENFVQPYANRLRTQLSMEVEVGKAGMVVRRNTIYICSTRENLKMVRQKEGHLVFETNAKMYKAYNHPSINSVMDSAVEHFGPKVIGVVLTGMGTDGTEGLKAIKDAGGLTIAQDESSSIVYGMPKSAQDAGVAKRVMKDKDIAPFIVSNF